MKRVFGITLELETKDKSVLLLDDVCACAREFIPQKPRPSGAKEEEPSLSDELPETDYQENIIDDHSLAIIRQENVDADDSSLKWIQIVKILKLTDSKCGFELEIYQSSTSAALIPAKPINKSPKLINGLSERFKLTKGNDSIKTVPEEIRHEKIDMLYKHLLAEERQLPAIVIASDKTTGRYPVKIDKLASELIGLADVFIFPTKYDASAFTEVMGSPLSVEDGMVRIFWPGLSLSDPSGQHPVREPRGGDRFIRRLVREIIDVAALRYVEDSKIEDTLRSLEQSQRDTQLAIAKDEARLPVERDYYELVQERDLLLQERDLLRVNLSEALSEKEKVKGELIAAQKNIDEITASYGKLVEVSYESPTAFTLTSVEEAVYGASEALEGNDSIIFADNAYASSTDSPYQNPQKIYEAILALGEVADAYKKGTAGPLVEAFRTMGIQYAQDISDTAKQKYEKHYTVKVDGEQYLLGPHIILGVGGPDTCARIYFSRDTKNKRFIIGHVGRHLPGADKF